MARPNRWQDPANAKFFQILILSKRSMLFRVSISTVTYSNDPFGILNCLKTPVPFHRFIPKPNLGSDEIKKK